jgi:hypothetical protein
LPNLLMLAYNIGPGYVESWSPVPASGCESWWRVVSRTRSRKPEASPKTSWSRTRVLIQSRTWALIQNQGPYPELGSLSRMWTLIQNVGSSPEPGSLSRTWALIQNQGLNPEPRAVSRTRGRIQNQGPYPEPRAVCRTWVLIQNQSLYPGPWGRGRVQKQGFYLELGSLSRIRGCILDHGAVSRSRVFTLNVCPYPAPESVSINQRSVSHYRFCSGALYLNVKLCSQFWHNQTF